MNQSLVSRPAPSGSDITASGSSSWPSGHLKRAAADVDDEQPPGGPAEPAPGGQESQPGLVLAGQHADARAGLVLDPREHIIGVARVANGGRGEGHEVLNALVLGHPQRLSDHLGQPLLAKRGKRVVPLQVGGEG